MVKLLCFVLDLRSLSLPVLRDLKQSLLQLANYYAVSCDGRDRAHSEPLLDRIGLCYVYRNRISRTDEEFKRWALSCIQLKVAYNPHGSFNLRDLHHALNSLPTDAFCPEFNDFGALCKDLKLGDVLSDKTVYAWGDHDKNIASKVVVISSCLVDSLDTITMNTLMGAADKCVSVEFIFLEQTSSHLGEITASIGHFAKQISSLRNCSFITCVPDQQVLRGLVKGWFQELKDDVKEPLQARIVFKINLSSSLNQISCNLHSSFSSIVDEFSFCQTCGCHGIPLDRSNMNQTKSSYCCPLTNDDLGVLDIIENSVKVGEQTILYMPSFQGCPKLQPVSSPVDFHVIQRTNLGSLSEGLIMGSTYFVTPSTFQDSDEKNNAELNSRFFQVVCRILNSLDQGLICCSSCNVETARETSFRCYYILLPSDKGLMLLRRLAASEEVLPIPDISQFISSAVAEEFENTIRAALLKMEVSDYNPLQNERGFHQKLNLLVKESLQFGAILPKSKDRIWDSVPVSSSEVPKLVPVSDAVVTADKVWQSDIGLGEVKTSPCLTEEWEQLIVTELGGIKAPTCSSHSKLDQVVTSPSQSNRQLDEKTSRILERLEVPRQLKRKAVSPTITSTVAENACTPTIAKKPLIPYGPAHAADQGPISSQPLRPNFQRIKKKR